MLFASLLLAAAMPELPDKDGAVSIVAQEWPHATSNGVWITSYENGYPVGRFEKKTP